jgi:alkaline phosphatase D
MTLLGRRQWEWLTQSLLNSTADVKVLASGIVWNEAVYPGKLDCWMAYPYERHALWKFIHSHGIPGVVLVSGDIHVSRIFQFPVDDVLKYPMYEFVSSPLAEGVALYNQIPSAYLKYSEPLDNVFLKLTVDSTHDATTLTAEYLTPDQDEPHHRLQLNVQTDLTAPAK